MASLRRVTRTGRQGDAAGNRFGDPAA